MITSLDEREELPFMAIEYALPEYSRRKVEAAGRALAGKLTDVDEAISVFRIAHNWRDAHVFPMRRVRFELAGITRKAKAEAITAARIKRMKSIRRKLEKSHLTLYQIQDVGGCRTIVRTIDELRRIISLYSDGYSRHGVIRHWPYVDEPKQGGYRSHHVVLKFNGNEDEQEAAYNRQRIEVQIRTRLQHAWATAVEAAGLVRGESLKGGKGDLNWLRLFEVMSSEIAALENSPGVPGVSDNVKERRQELRELNNIINATANLRNWNEAISKIEYIPNSIVKFYVIQYDPDTRRAIVEPSTRISQGSENVILEEQRHPRRDTVHVEIDRAEDLREAYPNYFLDVRVFANLLEGAMANKSIRELEQMIAPVIAKRTATPAGFGISVAGGSHYVFGVRLGDTISRNRLSNASRSSSASTSRANSRKRSYCSLSSILRLGVFRAVFRVVLVFAIEREPQLHRLPIWRIEPERSRRFRDWWRLGYESFGKSAACR